MVDGSVVPLELLGVATVDVLTPVFATGAKPKNPRYVLSCPRAVIHATNMRSNAPTVQVDCDTVGMILTEFLADENTNKQNHGDHD
jgi:hypothetical protein